MQMLKFHSRAGLLVNVPDSIRVVGQHAAYLGRAYDAESRAYRATEDPYRCAPDGKPAARLRKRVLRGENCVWPADKFTAAFCGVPFVRVKRDRFLKNSSPFIIIFIYKMYGYTRCCFLIRHNRLMNPIAIHPFSTIFWQQSRMNIDNFIREFSN